MRNFILAIVFLLPFISSALTLDEAIKNGSVAESDNGLVVAIKNTTDVVSLVDEINKVRQEQFQTVAESAGLSANEIAKITSKEKISNLPAGSKYMSGGKLLTK